VVAVSATAAVALLSGTAAATPEAAQPGKCTKNVNVRAEPDTDSRIVALCEQGTAVQVAESRDGFLRLANLGGWAAQEYISVNGRAPASSQQSEGDDDESSSRSSRDGDRSGDQARENRSRGSDGESNSDDRRSGSGGSGRGDDDGSEERSGSGGSSSAGSGSDESGESGDDSGSESGEGESGEGSSDDSDSDENPAPRARGGAGGLLG
jgi:uncharacterized protein YraI